MIFLSWIFSHIYIFKPIHTGTLQNMDHFRKLSLWMQTLCKGSFPDQYLNFALAAMMGSGMVYRSRLLALQATLDGVRMGAWVRGSCFAVRTTNVE